MILRVLTYLLFLIFAASGFAKLIALPFEVSAFERWGYALWFMYLVGALEVLGAIGLLVHRVSVLASFCLSLLMLGAISTHVMHQEWPMLVVALAITLATVWHGLKKKS